MFAGFVDACYDCVRDNALLKIAWAVNNVVASFGGLFVDRKGCGKRISRQHGGQSTRPHAAMAHNKRGDGWMGNAGNVQKAPVCCGACAKLAVQREQQRSV